MSARIDLDLGSDLMVTEDGYVTIRISPDEGNSLSLESDGLMSVGLSNITGWNSSEGQILQGLTIGPISIYNKNKSNPSGRISTTGIVHRTFTAHSESNIGEDLTGRMTYDKFRPDLDYCLPGDIFRVKVDKFDDEKPLFNYYLITKVDAKKEGDVYNPGNRVARYVKLGTWGDLNTDSSIEVPEPVKPQYKDSIDSITPGGSIAVVYDNGNVAEDRKPVEGDRVMISATAINWLSSTGTDDNGKTTFVIDRPIELLERNFIWYIKQVYEVDIDTNLEDTVFESVYDQPNAWSSVYTQYYEHIENTYEQLSTKELAPDFEEDKYYEQKQGLAKIYDKPDNWDNENEFLKYYVKTDHEITGVKIVIDSSTLSEGSIDHDTGEEIIDNLYVRTEMSSLCTPGYYKITTSDNTMRVMVFVYEIDSESSDISGEAVYSKESSILTLEELPCYITLTKNSYIRLVFLNDDMNISGITIQTWIHDVVDLYGVPEFDENANVLRYTTLTQLQSPTVFVSGWFYQFDDIYVLLKSQPENWDHTYTNYYRLIEGGYKRLTPEHGVPVFVRGKYYEPRLVRFDSKYMLQLTNDPKSDQPGGYAWISAVNVRKAPALDFGKIKKNTLVMLGNAPIWDHAEAYWTRDLPYSVEEIYSIWAIEDDIDPEINPVNDYDDWVTIYKKNVLNDSITKHKIQIKYLDLFNEIASVVELHVGDIVSIANDAQYWCTEDSIERNLQDPISTDEREMFTFLVTSRDLTTGIFGLNNGKFISRQYLCKISRVERQYTLTE